MYRPYATPLPVVEREWVRLLTLPLFPALTDDDVAYIIDTIRRFDA
jgi:perosamine synthetase